jgi:hypothetical protein
MNQPKKEYKNDILYQKDVIAATTIVASISFKANPAILVE